MRKGNISVYVSLLYGLFFIILLQLYCDDYED